MRRIGGNSLGTDDKKVLIVYSILRDEEKIIGRALKKRGINVLLFQSNKVPWKLGEDGLNVDLVINRVLSGSQAEYLSFLFEERGLKVINSFRTTFIANNKALTTELLSREGIPVPRTYLAFSPESALEAIERVGYPAVLKPVNGSWGRLLAKVNDRDAAEAVIYHRWSLGGVGSKVFYVQEYVKKPGRDIRVLVMGGRVRYAIYRNSSHWITNTARGGWAQLCPITEEIKTLSERVAQILGGDFIAIDLFESEGGILVNEVNSTPEFSRSSRDVGIDVGEIVADFVEEVFL